MSYAMVYSFPAKTYNSGSGLSITAADVDFRAIPATCTQGILHLRKIVLRIKGVCVQSSGTASCTYQPAAVVSNFALTVPGAPKADLISMPGITMTQIARLDNGGEYGGTSLVAGAVTNALYDGYSFTSSSGLTKAIDFELPLSWERPLSNNPDDFILPISAFQSGAAINVTLADPVGIGVAYGASSNVASFAGTVTIEAHLVALPHINVPGWTIWTRDSIPSTTTQSNGIARYDGATLSSGIGIDATAATNMDASDVTQLGYQTGSFQRSQNGTSTNLWYSAFNSANPANPLVPHTDFTGSTLAYSQTLPLVFASHKVSGQKLSDDVEPANRQVNFLADTFANATKNYSLVRRIVLSHAVGHNAVKQLAHVPPHAPGSQSLTAKTAGRASELVRAIAPFKYALVK